MSEGTIEEMEYKQEC